MHLITASLGQQAVSVPATSGEPSAGLQPPLSNPVEGQPQPAAEAFKIFFSLRLAEALPAARLLVAALEEARPELQGRIFCSGVTKARAGENLQKKIANALDTAGLVVIFGTTTYGKESELEPGGHSTYEELMFTKSESKPFFLIRMCEKIETATVRLTLGGAYKQVEWPVPPNRDLDAAVPIPTGLVDALLEAVNHFSHARAPAASAPSASPVKHRILHLHLAPTGLSPSSDPCNRRSSLRS